jgi:hypothetical protein
VIPVPVDNEAAAAERTRQAREAVILLKRTLTTYRSYAPGHAARVAATADLLSALRRYTSAFDDLFLQITSKAFFFNDEPLLTDEREEDATTRPLFVEGIQGLTLNRSLGLEELERFLALWHIAANARFPEGRSLGTEIWEADFKGIETRVVENFSEGTDVDDDGGAQARAQREELAVTLTRGMTAAKLPGGSVVDGKAMRFVSGADLLPLTSTAASGMSDDLLSRLAAARSDIVNPLSDAERDALVAELTAGSATVVRAHRALWTLVPDAQPEDREQLTALIARVTRRFIDDGAIDQLRQGLTQTLQAARVDPERAGQVAGFFGSLASPDVVGPLVVAARDDARRADAVAVLAFLDPSAMGMVLERIDDVIESAPATTALLEVVARKGTPPAAFARAIASLSTTTAPQTATALLDTLVKMRPAALADVLPACLKHRLPGVRRAALSRVAVDAVAGTASVLGDALVNDTDAGVRREVLGLLMRAKNPAAIAPLLALAQRADVDVDERQACLKAIAIFGTVAAPVVAAATRKMFDNEKDPDMRGACALVLGSIGDDASRAALETEAKRLFGNKSLKAAAAEALRRLDARGTAGGRSS